MTRFESQQVKGLAILMMLWYHLFDQADYFMLYSDICISGNTLSYYFARCCNPVYIFLVISGYGLYVSFKSGASLKRRISKNSKLYAKYAIIVTFFVIIGHICGIEKFDSISTYFKNITLYDTNYLVVYWFLLPYIIISICSRYILRVFERIPYLSLIVSAIIYFSVCYCYSRFGKYIWSSPLLDNLLHTIYLVFPFLVGAYFAKYEVFSVIKRKYSNLSDWVQVNERTNVLWGGHFYKVLLLLSILCLSILRMQTSSYAANIFYEPLLVVLFVLLPKHKITSAIFNFFGEKSTNLWFIHGWFCYVLLREELYNLRYAIIIYMALIGICLFISYLFDLLFKSLKLNN